MTASEFRYGNAKIRITYSLEILRFQSIIQGKVKMYLNKSRFVYITMQENMILHHFATRYTLLEFTIVVRC